MMNTITRASHEWWSRPDDERYVDIYKLHDAVTSRRQSSEVEVINVSHVEVSGQLKDITPDESVKEIHINVPTSLHGWQQLVPTHWSFGQLCTKAEAPATYIRKLHPELAAVNLNYGLKVLSKTDNSKLMVVKNPEQDIQKLHCLTGEDYGRIWDAQVSKLGIYLVESGWVVPAASYSVKNPVRATTLYASDRDIFIFLVRENVGCEVVDKYGQIHTLNQGIMVWNSEVGKMTFGASFFNYDFICDNRIVWGARNVKEFKMRHSKYAQDRFLYEAKPMLMDYASATMEDHSRVFKAAMEMEVGKDQKEVMDWLKKRGFNGAEQNRIIQQGRADRGGELPNTVWEIVAAGTAAARAIPHTDSRLDFERKSSNLLKLAEKKVEYVAA